MGSAEGGSHQLSKLLYLSKYNGLICSLLNPVTSTDTRRKEMRKDFRGVIIFSREGPDVILRAKLNVGLFWEHIHSRYGSLKYPMKRNALYQWVKLFRCESGPSCGWWVRGWPIGVAACPQFQEVATMEECRLSATDAQLQGRMNCQVCKSDLKLASLATY